MEDEEGVGRTVGSLGTREEEEGGGKGLRDVRGGVRGSLRFRVTGFVNMYNGIKGMSLKIGDLRDGFSRKR